MIMWPPIMTSMRCIPSSAICRPRRAITLVTFGASTTGPAIGKAGAEPVRAASVLLTSSSLTGKQGRNRGRFRQRRDVAVVARPVAVKHNEVADGVQRQDGMVPHARCVVD